MVSRHGAGKGSEVQIVTITIVRTLTQMIVVILMVRMIMVGLCGFQIFLVQLQTQIIVWELYCQK